MSPSVNIQLSTEALRKALDLLESGKNASLDELVEALILGSPSGQALPTRVGQTGDAEPGDVSDLIGRPHDRLPLELAEPTAPSGQLQFLTNRFGPLKIATRALANLARTGEWPELASFQSEAAAVARRVGQQLRAEDVDRGHRGAERRWVAYPVGENAKAASERYAFSFTLFPGEYEATGPLAQLGFANIEDGRAVLTEGGWTFAVLANPVLDGDGVGTLSADEVGILRVALLRLPDEAAAIKEFLKAVRTAAGAQGRVDELLNAWHGDWTADRAAAQRSAMLGRLGELGILRVTGRGPSARIELVDSLEFERDNEKG